MIITRTPLRVCLGGGGTDLKSYYEHKGGFFISAAINKYIYISLSKIFKPGYIIKYSQIEKTERIQQIEHPLVREAFKLHNIPDRIELNCLADIPAGTGLGSSGSFTVGLLKAIYELKEHVVTKQHLAEEACKIEIDFLKRPVGKQDQYISSFGGITVFEIDTKGRVTVNPLSISKETFDDLQENLLLFFTGYSRESTTILKEQHEKSKKLNSEMIQNLNFIKKLGIKSKNALISGDLNNFAELMNVHWNYKKKRSSVMTNPDINLWYELGMNNGALGGKLIGAGGGGFLMFYVKDKVAIRKAMNDAGLEEVKFNFDYEGTKTVINVGL